METKRRALGSGLEQLFSNEPLDFNKFESSILESASVNDVVEINLDELRSNPYQPRKRFDENALLELATSIKEHGVFQPIIVKKAIKGYEIIAGERRVKASVMAGMKTIPAIVKHFNDDEMMQIALLENIQREDLTPIEEAMAYKNIIESLNLTQEEFANRIGKSRSHITNLLGILSLPSRVQDMIMDNVISLGHAKVLSKLEDTEKILDLSLKIKSDNLSVRDIEKIVANEEFKKKRVLPKRKESNAEYKGLESIMSEKLGTKVNITDKKVEISFVSKNDLTRIVEILNIDINE